MFAIFSRRLWGNLSSIHAPFRHKPPVQPIYYTDRGLVVHPRIDKMKEEIPIEFKIVPRVQETKEEEGELNLPRTTYPYNIEKIEPPTVHVKKRGIPTSYKKLLEITWAVSKLHVYDALWVTDSTIRKPARYIKSAINTARRYAVYQHGMSDDRLYVKSVTVGRQRGVQGMRYHGRGRGYMMLHPKANMFLVLEEKPVKEIYRLIMLGKYSPAMAHFLRESLLEEDADLAKVRKYQHLLTAKGRQQNKLMFKRRVEKLVQESFDAGVPVSSEMAFDKLLDEEATEYERVYWEAKDLQREERLAARQEIFARNQGL